VVAAPPLPATPTEVVAVADNGNNLVVVPNPNLQLKLLLPDLKVATMDVPATVLLGATVNVTIKVKNIGSGNASNFTVQWWAGSNLGCSWPVDALAAGAAKDFSCSYSFPNAGDYSVKAVVDSGATVAESSESNNTSQKSVQVNKLKLLVTLPAPIIQFP
jgi:subtilase family serine protease